MLESGRAAVPISLVPEDAPVGDGWDRDTGGGLRQRAGGVVGEVTQARRDLGGQPAKQESGHGTSGIVGRGRYGERFYRTLTQVLPGRLYAKVCILPSSPVPVTETSDHVQA